MTDYDLSFVPIKRASQDIGRKLKFWDDAAGTTAAVVKDQAGNTLTQPIKVPASGHLELRFDQWPVYFSTNRSWTTVAMVPGMPTTLDNAITGLTADGAELNALDGVTAGTVTASKAVVVGANKNIDTIVIPVNGLKLGSGAGTAVAATADEINKLGSVTAGTAAASKAAVLGANKNLDELHLAKLYLGAAAGTEVTATAAELNALADSFLVPQIYDVTATLEDLNAGTKVIVPGVADTTFVVLDAWMQAIGGAVGACTLVRLIEETSSAVILSHVRADMTQNTWVGKTGGTVVTTAMGFPLVANKDILLDKTGSAADTVTHVRVVVHGFYIDLS